MVARSTKRSSPEHLLIRSTPSMPGPPAIEWNVEHGENNALTRLGKTDVNVSLENHPEGVYGIVRFINDTISDDIFTRVKTGLVRGLSVEASKVPGFEPGFDVWRD